MKGMEELWLEAPEAACIHPGHPPLYGYQAIMDSWQQIFTEPTFLVSAANVVSSERVLDAYRAHTSAHLVS